MLLERKMSCALDALRKAKEASERQIDITKLRTNLQNAQVALSKIYRNLQLFDKAGQLDVIDCIMPEDLSKEVYSALMSCRNELTDNQLQQITAEQMGQSSSSLQRHLQLKWSTSQYIANALQAQRSLSLCSSFMPDPDKARQMANVIQNLAENMPLESGKIQTLIDHVNTASSMIAQTGFDDDIRNYIDKVQRGGATINDLSPKVLNWLRDNKLGNKFKISVI